MIPRRAWWLQALPVLAALLWWLVGGGWNAVFATVGGGASLLGTAILAIRMITLRGRRPAAAMSLMMVNLASRFGLVALGMLVLLPEVSAIRAVFYLVGFFVVQGLFMAAMWNVEG